ncbi:AC4 protein [Jacquemontia yellow vein virus]|uniref:AC4 protein n=1 Tax=Jacquemontia yellow vein virus TaxID=1982675 RepID=A0A1W6GWI8_9GEMI|nr:AC4 protein [Jacquemontia yellow vein virus]ARM20158.1 AC4 protein [Jacquemontia yellow vein virus]ARM20163.1 AC4 protein [Jacquemontia yellow vein virus]
MKLFRCFNPYHGQLSNPHTSESPERNMPMGSLTYTASSNYRGSPTSRMLDFSTSLTQEGLPIFTQISRQPKTPTPSRITSPKKVIIVNPDCTRCLGEQSQTKTTSTTTLSMHLVRERLSTL